MYALADCNNFYASCERVFQPRLVGRPVIVLSNNDGCVIARSNEVKALGVALGEPYFKIKQLIRKHGIVIRSSNYTLYGDMSHRVMRTLERFSPEVEVYSIDEAFINLAGIQHEPTAYARQIRAMVLQHTGIPISLGIAPTKTLAKVANKLAKRNPTSGGVLPLTDPAGRADALRGLDVGDVWGVGPRYAAMLKRAGIATALDLRDAELGWVQRHMTVVGLRTVLELRGESCIALELVAPLRQQIIRSRSFGRPVSALEELQEAVATHASRAAEKLHLQGLAANLLSVFITTNPFKPDSPQYANSVTMRLPVARSDTPTLIHWSIAGLRHIYREGFIYKKVGVVLLDLVGSDRVQGNLFIQQDTSRVGRVMETLDQINRRWGKRVIGYAAAGIERTWAMRREFCSPHYTTRWADLPVVKA